jgi:hypothetical protein
MLLKQSTARSLAVFMTDSSDHVTGKTGLTLTITASKDGAAFGSISPTVTELATGWYKLALTTSHTDTLGDFALHITATGADPTDMVRQVVVDLPGASVSSVTGAVGSVTGSVGSVTGAVGSVTGNVGGNVVGSVASVTARVTANTDQLAGQTVTAAAGVTFPTSVASPTNITAGTITTASNVGSLNDSAIKYSSFATTTGMRPWHLAGSGGTANTITLANSGDTVSNVDDYYTGSMLYLAVGATGGESPRVITAYNGTTKVATVAPNFNTTPSGSFTVTIRQWVQPTGVQGNVTGSVGSVTGAVGSVTGAVGSVTGAVGSVTGAVGSVTGNVGGNVVGSVASVTARVTANTDQLAGQTVTAGAGVTFPTSVASPTNITAGTITTVTNLTNAPTAGDLTATMKTSVTTAATAATPTAAAVTGAVGSVTGNVGGNVVGSVASVSGAVGSVTGNVGGNVTGSIGSLAAQAKLDVNAEADTALADAGVTTTVTGRIDAAISTRLAAASYTAPDNTSITAIRLVSDALGDVLEADSSPANWRFTAHALSQVPTTSSGPTLSQIVNGVWNELLAGHTTVGSAGKALSAASSAGDPWATVFDGLEAGDILRILAAVAAGKTAIVSSGGGAATVTFRDVADASDIVVATMAGSERTAVALSP